MRQRGNLIPWLLGIIVLCWIGHLDAGPVVGIDIGSTWSKVAMIQGQNLDLVLDDTGARRRNTWVGIRGDERVFGRDAERMLMRFPTNVFKNSIDMIGKSKEQIAEIGVGHLPFFSMMEDTDRNTTEIVLDEETSFLPEELLAMFFQESLKVAGAKAGMKVMDCVVVVPNFFTHHQRQALLDAAKIADANVLGLMNVGTAAALTYGLNRDKDTKELHQKILFYDMGSGSTKVSVVEFKMVEDHKKNKTVPLIQTIGHGWDETLGGREFDLRIANFFGRKAEERLGEEGTILYNKRTMQRLLREAKKAKEVLSANQEAHISIPDLVQDFDFQASITRAEFERECQDLLERVVPPIEAAFATAGVSKEDIDFVEVIGGGVRVPKIIKLISEFVGKDADRHLNGDEAAVFGAAFYAATQSTSFRVKSDIRLKDSTAYGVDVEVDGVDLGKADNQALLFKAMNRYGSLKKLSFGLGEERASHFSLRLMYNATNSLSEFAPKEMVEFNITGVPVEGDLEFVDQPKVTLSFRLGTTGIIDVEKAEVEYSILVEEKVVSEDEKEEEEGEKKGEEGEVPASETAPGEEEESEKEEAEKQGEEEEEEEEKEEEEEEVVEYVKVKKTKQKLLNVEKRPLGALPLSKKNITDSKKKLRELDRADQLKLDTEEARNSLESFIYAMREKLSEDDEFLKFTNQPEVDDIFEILYQSSEWLDEEGDDAKLDVLKKKMKAITDKTDAIVHRQEEHEHRDQALYLFIQALIKFKNETSNITNSHEVEEEELVEFMTYLVGQREEVMEMYTSQKEMALDVDPVFTKADLEKRRKEIEGRVRRFKFRPRRKPKVVVEEEIEVGEEGDEEKEEIVEDDVIVEEEEEAVVEEEGGAFDEL